MILISHRGNIDGRIPSRENHPSYIQDAIDFGYEVEIDAWMIEGALLLGHDEPQYGVSQHWLNQRFDKLWIHCKNTEALAWFNIIGGFKYFWHQEDDYTLVSNGLVWVYPGKELLENSICCLPERVYKGDIEKCYAICTDEIEKYII